MLTENRQGPSQAATSSTSSLLAGRLFDDRGNLMSPSHARKANGRRYRYYVSQAVLQGKSESAGAVRRVSAGAIESVVEHNLCKKLPKARQVEWAGLSGEQKREHLRRLIERVTIMADRVEIRLTDVGCSLMAASSETDMHRHNNEGWPGRSTDRSAEWPNVGAIGSFAGEGNRVGSRHAASSRAPRRHRRARPCPGRRMLSTVRYPNYQVGVPCSCDNSSHPRWRAAASSYSCRSDAARHPGRLDRAAPRARLPLELLSIGLRASSRGIPVVRDCVWPAMHPQV